MSGGKFNHLRLNEIAEEIERIVKENKDESINEYGDPVGYGFSDGTIDKLNQAVECLQKAQIMAHRIDWLLSSDDSEETFHKRWDEELKGK